MFVPKVLIFAFLAGSSIAFISPQSFATQRKIPKNEDIILSPDQVVTTREDKSTSLFGIPKMFRWLTDQYPNINRRLSEGLTQDTHVDNFYLDMNGIIHPCTHGNNEDQIVVLDETAMFKKIFAYVDRLYKIVRPRKVLYLAVDGVAPRAKMNQQRSRRFRSASEAEQLAATILARDGVLPDGKKFDSNCITPGTDFMLKLSLAMNKWIEYKQKTDPFWKNGADVVFTGPDVPGEGEHKVMDYIRETREQYVDENNHHPHWQPELTHVLYGLDADLIMLGLITHEPKFLLLREKMSVVMAGRGRHKGRKKKDMLEYTRDDFELLELQMLRELFQIQFRKLADPEIFACEYDPNRIIDDFVFMCMLVGNDFLPHCPHLEIDNGALSLMLSNYIDLLPEWNGYLTDKEKIHPDRFEQFIYHLAVYEEEHFKRRGYEENEAGWQLSSENEVEKYDFYGKWYGGGKTPKAAVNANKKPEKKVDTIGAEASDSAVAAFNFKGNNDVGDSRSYRDYYYSTKLGWSPRKEKVDETLLNRRAHVRDYLEGLHWVLAYYHQGCQTWDWYFPHLYSPLATDLVNLDEFYESSEAEGNDDGGYKTFPFQQTIPFPSLAQLLSVLPPQSAELLPKPLSELMIQPSSPIADYYPREFTSDANGKRQPWEAVVQIPFIDADTLLGVTNSILEQDEKQQKNGEEKTLLTVAERRRNVRGESHLFVPTRDNGGSVADFSNIPEDPSLTGPPRRYGRPSNRRTGKVTGRPAGRGAGRGSGRGGGRGRGRGRGRGAGRFAGRGAGRSSI